MAAKTTVKVAVTNNAAKDDLFSGDTDGYDWLSEDGSLKGDLNVLGNDPGSAKLLGVSDTIPTTSTPLSMTQTTDTISVDAFGQPLPTGATIKLTANTDGTVGFDASALYGKLGYLAEGETVSVTFYYTAQMANGAYSVAKVTIQLTGDNDAPTVQSVEKTIQDTADTDDFGNITGNLVGSDADNNAVLTYGLADGEDGVSDYGTLTVDANGAYTFVPDDAAINALKGDQDVTFNVKVTDEHGAEGTATITIHLKGVNDTATISGDTAGDVTEDGATQEAHGTLAVSDVDTGDAVFQPVDAGDLAGDYGTFTFDETTGEWTYTLDNAAANHLAKDATDTDTLTVTSLDGTGTETITVTIHGANDEAQFGGDDTGEVTEDSDLNTGGTLSVDDDDDNESSFVSTSSLTADHGTFTFDLASGAWTYALNNDDPALDDLDADDDPLTDTLTVYSTDGSSHEIVVTINGADEAPVGPPAAPQLNNGTGDPNDHDTDTATATTTTWNASTGGNDVKVGNASNNTIDGGNGDDKILGGAGDDTLNGNNDNDTILGQQGNDTINGGGGLDTIYAGSGDDSVLGSGGADTIYGGSNHDTIDGGDGNDLIIGGYGPDTLTGGGGNDTFQYLSGADTGDTITDFKANGNADKIDLSALYSGTLGFVGGDSGDNVVANSVTWTEFGGNTVVSVDFTGDTTADLQITLTGTGLALTSTDFVL